MAQSRRQPSKRRQLQRNRGGGGEGIMAAASAESLAKMAAKWRQQTAVAKIS